MGVFNFFKRKADQPEEEKKEKYWSLVTNEGEVLNPTLGQIETAVANATPDHTMFATLTYNHSGLEIDSVQAISQEGFYRFEALTADGRMYVKNDLTYEETFELFTHFFNYQRVSGVKSWAVEDY